MSAARSRTSSCGPTIRTAWRNITRDGWRRIPKTSMPWPGWPRCWPGRPALPEGPGVAGQGPQAGSCRRKELRQAFIEQLVDDQRFAEAISQYELLDKADPNNPDYLRDWGKLVLRDTRARRPTGRRRRKRSGGGCWRPAERSAGRHAGGRSVPSCRDAATRRSPFIEKAVELLPITAIPRVPRRVLSQLKRTDEALATWRKIIAGQEADRQQSARLAEVLASVWILEGRFPRSRPPASFDPKDFSHAGEGSDLLAKAEKYAAHWPRMESRKLAQNDEARSGPHAAATRFIQLENSLARLTAELAAATAETRRSSIGSCSPAITRHPRQYPEATRAIGGGAEARAQSIPSWPPPPASMNNAGDLKSAADSTASWRSSIAAAAADYLQYVAHLETQLGRRRGLAAGRS